MTCKNCQTELEAKDNFCKNCGGKIIRKRLTIRNIFEQFSEHFLNYDNKFLQTFICLFTKPEDVIDGYINGVRKKYVNVISYFAIALTISGLQLYILDKFFPEAMDMSALTVQGSGQDSNEMMSFIREYQSLLMMVNVPAYALISYFVFYTLKKYNYTEHLVIFMYVLSQLTILGVIISLSSAWLGLSIAHSSLLLMPIQFIYSLFCLQKLYKLSFKGMFLRSLLFFLITLIIFVFLTIIYIVIAYLDGSLMKQIEAQRAEKQKLGYLFLLHKLHLV